MILSGEFRHRTKTWSNKQQVSFRHIRYRVLKTVFWLAMIQAMATLSVLMKIPKEGLEIVVSGCCNLQLNTILVVFSVACCPVCAGGRTQLSRLDRIKLCKKYVASDICREFNKSAKGSAHAIRYLVNRLSCLK
jgi:hypothetical protein